jgi:genome maintenance exonuclease 1
MFWNKKFNYPPSTRTSINGARYYEINDTKLPSVTEILKATESEHKKNSLLKWRQKIGDKEANRIMQVSSARGTSMHKHIEDYLTGQVKLDFLASENEESLIMSEQIIQKGISNLDELWGAEVTLSYPNSYAGTADASGIYGGKQSILDFKQSNKPKKRDWIEDYFLQISAYALAHNKTYDTQISQGVILVCTPPPETLFQEFIVDGDEFIEYQKKFLKNVEQFNLLLRNS